MQTRRPSSSFVVGWAMSATLSACNGSTPGTDASHDGATPDTVTVRDGATMSDGAGGTDREAPTDALVPTDTPTAMDASHTDVRVTDVPVARDASPPLDASGSTRPGPTNTVYRLARC